MFTMTETAAAQIHASIETQPAPMALRVAARRLPDGEIDYALGFDDERANDSETTVRGVRVLISQHSAELLRQIQLDWVELTPGEFNFIFVPIEAPQDTPPPSSQGGCGSGCGCSGKSGQ